MQLTHLFFLCLFIFLADFVNSIAGGGALIYIFHMSTGIYLKASKPIRSTDFYFFIKLF